MRMSQPRNEAWKKYGSDNVSDCKPEVQLCFSYLHVAINQPVQFKVLVVITKRIDKLFSDLFQNVIIDLDNLRLLP